MKVNFSAAPFHSTPRTRLVPPAPAKKREWSEYQLAIFDFIEQDKGNLIIEAVAGSGKTTTLVEATKRARGSTIFLAFNKAIAEELKNRGIYARTFHSLAFQPVMRSRKATTISEDKVTKLIRATLSSDHRMWYEPFVRRLVGLAKNGGVGALPQAPISPQAFIEIIEHHELELEAPSPDATVDEAIAYAIDILNLSNASNEVDFDDLLYFALLDNAPLPKFDFVFVDEAQDTNRVQREILHRLLRRTSRLIAVGDPAQAIYGFRGADASAMDKILSEFCCKILPLSISYRCSRAVVEFARSWVSHIDYAPDAPVGEVTHRGRDWQLSDLTPNSLVVCRTSAPMIALAYRLLKARIPVKVLGREIGAGLLALINKLQPTSIADLDAKLSEWQIKEVEKAIEKNQDRKLASIADRATALRSLLEDLKTIAELEDVIRTLFGGPAAANSISLATIHKAKGLEADTVFWLNASECPPFWVKGGWQLTQEYNLCYVATTRAKTRLVLIESPKNRVFPQPQP